ncbi:DMT family transporter [Nonomuraea sp. SYSU D8015]|uniref:DMT family transporter n=1 Tax=Nonomuraea sp. SYSU D8015 TaxID=2593644 RepID=UPI001660D4CA|nr:multidrug efflux SMR transporter [Nonomuraea sp. SYSU D8015]
MAWLLLALAIAIEIGASTALTAAASHGQAPGASAPLTALALAGVVLSYILMAAALRQQMEVGIAYAIWSGVGTAAIAVIGIVAFGESISLTKTLAIVLIISGVTMLQLAPQARTTTAARTTMPPSRPAVVVVRPDTIQALTLALTDLTTALAPLRPPNTALAPATRSVAEPAALGPRTAFLPDVLLTAAAAVVSPQRRVPVDATHTRHADRSTAGTSPRAGTTTAARSGQPRPPSMTSPLDGEPHVFMAASR